MRKVKRLLALLILILTSNISAQTICDDGMAGDYPCSGYDLMSFLNKEALGISSLGNGNDCWGWTHPETGQEIVLMGANNKTIFVDVTDPINPSILGFLQSGNGLHRDIKVFNNHAFIVSEYPGHGMHVFNLMLLGDVVSPPVIFDSEVVLGAFSAHNLAINEGSGFAYILGDNSSFEGGPGFVDISDPVNPVFVGGYDGWGYSHDAQVINYSGPDEDYIEDEILIGFNGNHVGFLNISDKTNPQLISTFSYDSIGYAHQGWLNEDQTLLYVNDEFDEGLFDFNTRTIVIDVSDLENPFLTGEYFGTGFETDHNLYVHEGKVYESNYSAGLRVLQIIDDPEVLLEEIGYFDTNYGDPDQYPYGAWSNYPFFESGNIAISAIEGLFIVREQPVGVAETAQFLSVIYPNPASLILKVKLTSDEEISKLVVYDFSGRIVDAFENPIGSTNYDLDVSSLTNGMYFIKLNDSPQTVRFIVQH